MRGKPDLTEVGDGIYYLRDPAAVVTADREMVTFLKNAATKSPRRRARLCAHPNAEALQHDMLIVSRYDTYVAPHRHLDKSETMLVIEGEARAILFDDIGNVDEVLPMAPLALDRTFFYRMPARRFHGLLIDSDVLVFVESTRGPFRIADSQNAPWAPAPIDDEAGAVFTAALRARFDKKG